jgi:hypothetical protein
LNFADLLYLDREGVGIRFGNEFSTEDLTCGIYSFTRLSPKSLPVAGVGGTFFPSVVTTTSGGCIRKYILIGGAPTSTGNSYIFMFRGIMARYTPVPGDSIATVVAGLKNEINGTDFGSYEITAASSSNILTITFNNSFQIPGMYNAYNDSLQFESGLYAKISILGEESDYLIERNESNDDFPSIPAVAGSYAFSSLTNVGAIENYIKLFHSPLYTITYNSYYAATGTASITGVPFVVPTTSSAVYDQPNSRFVFSNQSPLKPQEVAILVYR